MAVSSCTGPISHCETRHSPISGDGLFTLSFIPQGTAIISEPPIITTYRDRRTDIVDTHAILEAFEQLSLREKAEYLELEPSTADSSEDAIMARFCINAFDDSGKRPHPDKQFMGVYLQASKINHSCSPNVFATWVNDGDAISHIVALRDIMEGEELLVNYVDDEELEERQGKLLEGWGFVCKCKKCIMEGTRAVREEQRFLEEKS